MVNKVVSSIKRFFRDRTASVTVIVSLALVPLAIGSGVAVDLSRTMSVKTRIQAAMDAAVISSVLLTPANRDAYATPMFVSQANAAGLTVSTPVFVTKVDKSYQGTVNVTVPMTLMKLAGRNQIDLVITAVASAPVEDNSCILAFGKSQAVTTNSINLNGASNLNLSGCKLRSNTSMSCNGHSGLAEASIAAGNVTGACQSPIPNASTIPDIHAKLASNITRQCGLTVYNLSWQVGTPPSSPQMITVVNNGITEYHVCGNVTVKGTGVILGNASTDSLLVIENGDLTIDKDANVTLTRTGIVMTGTTGSHSVKFPQGNGQAATLRLTPGTDNANPWQGVGIYQDPSLTTNVDISWGPGANLYADGLLYFPNADFTISGNAASNSGQCSKLVVDTFTSNGSVALKQSDAACAAIGLKQYKMSPTLLF